MSLRFLRELSFDLCLKASVAKSQTQLSDFHFHYAASLVAQLVKNAPAIWETWVRSLGSEDPLEKGKLSTLVFWPGVAKSQTGLRDFHFHFKGI